MKNIKDTTVVGYLVDAIAVGLPFDYKLCGISNEAIEQVESAIRKPPVNSSKIIN